jgi:peptidoglycan/xylan/chitin deacetylase (PgdA/CDA1 family)
VGRCGVKFLPGFKNKLGTLAVYFIFYIGGFQPIRAFARYFLIHHNEKFSNIFPFQIRKRRFQSIQILAYHRINSQKDEYFSAIDIPRFENQVAYLVEKFRIVPAKEGVQRLLEGDLPPNCVIVTFDDGYRDNFTNAFPILKKYNVDATFFLATGCLNGSDVLWHDQVCCAIRKTIRTTLDLSDFNGKKYVLSSDRLREQAIHSVLWDLREIPNERRKIWGRIVLERLGILETSMDPPKNPLMLNWHEARSLREGGMTFGAHTVTHPILSQTTIEEAKQEIENSKLAIETHLQLQVESFAYPSGRKADFNEKIKELVKESGFACAFSMIYGSNEFGVDPFALRRIPVGNWDLPYFEKVLAWSKF